MPFRLGRATGVSRKSHPPMFTMARQRISSVMVFLRQRSCARVQWHPGDLAVPIRCVADAMHGMVERAPPRCNDLQQSIFYSAYRVVVTQQPSTRAFKLITHRVVHIRRFGSDAASADAVSRGQLFRVI